MVRIRVLSLHSRSEENQRILCFQTLWWLMAASNRLQRLSTRRPGLTSSQSEEETVLWSMTPQSLFPCRAQAALVSPWKFRGRRPGGWTKVRHKGRASSNQLRRGQDYSNERGHSEQLPARSLSTTDHSESITPSWLFPSNQDTAASLQTICAFSFLGAKQTWISPQACEEL